MKLDLVDQFCSRGRSWSSTWGRSNQRRANKCDLVPLWPSFWRNPVEILVQARPQSGIPFRNRHGENHEERQGRPAAFGQASSFCCFVSSLVSTSPLIFVSIGSLANWMLFAECAISHWMIQLLDIRFAGRKAVIVKPSDEGTSDQPFRLTISHLN